MKTLTEESPLHTRLDLRKRIRIELAHLDNFSDGIPPLQGHPPGALHLFINHHAEHMITTINEIMTAETDESLEERNETATDYIKAFMNHFGVEMFRVGQETAPTMPYDKLTPCPCDTLTEDDLQELLQ